MNENTPELGKFAAKSTNTDPVSRLQVILMAEWARVDPTSEVAQHPFSSIENFRDMAKAALTYLEIPWQEVNRIAPDS